MGAMPLAGSLIKNSSENEIKDAIKEAVVKITPEMSESNSSSSEDLPHMHVKKFSFFAFYGVTIAQNAIIWGIAGIAIGGILGGIATLGIATPLLVLIGFLAGVVVGLAVGTISCLIHKRATDAPYQLSSGTHKITHERLLDRNAPQPKAPKAPKAPQSLLVLSDDEESENQTPNIKESHRPAPKNDEEALILRRH